MHFLYNSRDEGEFVAVLLMKAMDAVRLWSSFFYHGIICRYVFKLTHLLLEPRRKELLCSFSKRLSEPLTLRQVFFEVRGLEL